MKNAMKILSILLLAGSLSLSNAKANNKFNVNIKDQTKVQVELTEFGDNYSIEIRNSIGEKIYETHNLSIVNLKFSVDLLNQEKGLYHLIVKNDVKMKKVPILIGEQFVSINTNQIKTTFFPQLEKNGNSVLVKVISNGESDLQLDILNDLGINLYHTQIGGQNGMVGKKFWFEPGDYIVTFNSNDYQFQKELNIK
ncbi:MAG: hypothetical protein RJQ05_00420 [Cytophagales bacterium]